MKKSLRIIFISAFIVGVALSAAGAKEEAVVSLPGHELGDSAFSLSVGIFLPLFYVDFTPSVAPGNSSIGGTGSIQWSAYINETIRLGIEFGGAFSYDPNGDMYWLVPITFKSAYIFSFSRFEIPVYLGAGINLIMYKELFNIHLALHPGFGVFWRYDANLSFGVNATWMCNLEFATDKADAILGNFLTVSPALYYHF